MLSKNLFLFLLTLVLVPTITFAQNNSSIRNSDGVGSYVSGFCAKGANGKAEGVLERVILEPVMGKFKSAHLACCAANVTRACGPEVQDAPTVNNVEGGRTGICLASRGISPTSSAFSACSNETCQAWAKDCGGEFDIEEIYNKLHGHDD